MPCFTVTPKVVNMHFFGTRQLDSKVSEVRFSFLSVAALFTFWTSCFSSQTSLKDERVRYRCIAPPLPRRVIRNQVHALTTEVLSQGQREPQSSFIALSQRNSRKSAPDPGDFSFRNIFDHCLSLSFHFTTAFHFACLFVTAKRP